MRTYPLLSPLSMLAALVILNGCASVGKDFRTEPVANIILGRTTESEIQTWFGNPSENRTMSSSKIESVIKRYVYAEGTPNSAVGRSLSIEIVNGLVNGFIFRSSFDHDKTDFDHTKRSSITVGRTTKGGVEDLLGISSGKAFRPTNVIEYFFGKDLEPKLDRPAKEVWTYSYSVTGREEGMIKTKWKYLIIDFDSLGIVTDTKFVNDIP